jgi:hypothetical protein
MELELATTTDIVEELLGRQLRFVFVVVENGNCDLNRSAYLAGQGLSTEDVLRLVAIAQTAFRDIRGDEGAP